MKNLLIVDGNSILNRAFYGVHTLTASDGLNTNAIFGMINILKRHLDNLKPDYAVIAFDLRAKTFRHKACDFYKATRKPMPEELAEQLPYAKECISYLGFNIIEKEGFEADDILGTVSRLAKDDVHAYILTGDKDSLQLINDNTSVILVKTKEDIIYNEEKFIADYGVTPLQYIDVKSIMGDSSDNIPGISGIGEKGAFKLISDFGSLERLYDEYEGSSLSASMKEKIRAGKDMAFTSKFLATIVCDVPIEKTLEDIEYKGIEGEKLSNIFTRLEFHSLIKKFNLEIKPKEIVSPVLESFETIELPFEENILERFDGEVCAIYFGMNGMQICSEKYNFVYEKDDTYDFLKRNKIVCYDFKNLCKQYNLNCVFDIMLAAYVLSSSNASYSLNDLCVKYLGCEFSDERGAMLIFKLYKVLESKLKEDNMLSVLTDIEVPLAKVLAKMEEEGFRVDTAGIKEYSLYLSSLAESCKERIYMLAGEVFNINSPKQLGIVLFEKLGLPHGKSKNGSYSTSAEILEGLSDKYEIINEILEYRQLVKLNSTYCEGLLKMADENGRIHTTFNQTVTATGRLSSTEPNLQNIPVRTELGKQLRKYFITKNDDYVLIDADYSQIELKVLAHLSKDANMMFAFNNGIDIHTMTASQVFGVDPEYVTPSMRKSAKAVNFGIVYGIGEFSLAKDLHISRTEARNYINSYFATYPDIKVFINSLVEKAHNLGYAETVFGRRRYIPEISASNKNLQAFGERVAMNSPIQGTAADIIKIAMINVNRALEEAKIDAKLILQVHDELIIESHISCAEKAKEILKSEMEKAFSLSVPLTTDTAMGKNWFDAK